MSTPVFRLKPLERREILRAMAPGSHVAIDYLPARHMDARTVVGELLGYGWCATAQTTDSLVVRPGGPRPSRWVLQVLLATSLVRVQLVTFDAEGHALTGVTLAGPDHPGGERRVHPIDFAGVTR